MATSNFVFWKEIPSIFDEIRAIETDSYILIFDQVVWNLYEDAFKDELEKFEDKVILWKCPSGEAAKDFKEYTSCVEHVLAKGIHRKSHLICIGGGATSDFGGFVAHTLLRGIKWSVVPTTLLSMVDACIGGKVALNTEQGKNLIGGFNLPTNIWFNDAFLDSLDEKEMKCGYGEVLKYCLLDPETIGTLVSSKKGICDIIEACALYKDKIVEEDFKESGKRKFLNLGHTIGHAVERIYQIPHGEAVFWGMCLIALIFDNKKAIQQLKLFQSSLQSGIEDSPWFHKNFPLDDVMNFLTKDKKMVSNDMVDLIVFGDNEINIKTTSIKEVEERLEERSEILRQFKLEDF